jgi:L-lactate dehydrogenase complex protein LldG
LKAKGEGRVSRDLFLERVRQAARQGQAYRVHVNEVPAETGYVGVAGDVCEALAREIDAVGGLAYVVADYGAAREVLVRLLTEAEAQSALCWKHPVLDALGLGELLAGLTIQRHDYDSLAMLAPPLQRSEELACDVGITSVERAIAETGTLMMWHRPGRERIASLLPPLHIAIVHESQIVPDLFDAVSLLIENGTQQMPSNVTLITGPSKTGDIELQLTTGVHGPGKWRVIIVRA